MQLRASERIVEQDADAVEAFLESLPTNLTARQTWSPDLTPANEGFTIPAKVNYVAKGANLFDLGYEAGTTQVYRSPGAALFEVDGVSRQIAEESLALAAAKLPIKTRFVARLGE